MLTPYESSIFMPVIAVLSVAVFALPFAMRKHKAICNAVKKLADHTLELFALVLLGIATFEGPVSFRALAIMVVCMPRILVWIAGPDQTAKKTEAAA